MLTESEDLSKTQQPAHEQEENPQAAAQERPLSDMTLHCVGHAANIERITAGLMHMWMLGKGACQCEDLLALPDCWDCQAAADLYEYCCAGNTGLTAVEAGGPQEQFVQWRLELYLEHCYHRLAISDCR